MNCMCASITQHTQQIIVDTPELVTHQVACKVHMGALRNGTGLRIELQVEEDPNPECLVSFMGDVPCSWV